jgi:hypothetical protein
LPHLVEPVDPLPMEGVDAAIRLAPPARVSAEHVMGNTSSQIKFFWKKSGLKSERLSSTRSLSVI